MRVNSIRGFPRLSTIDMVHRPVERFREMLDPTIAGRGLLSPLDAYLLHLVIEFCPQPIFVADLVCDATSGSSSVVCLANSGAIRVALAISDGLRRTGGASLGDQLEEFVAHDDFVQGKVVLRLGRTEVAWDAIRSALSSRELPLFLLDPTDPCSTSSLQIGEILDEFPRALVLAFSIGKAGECESAQRLVGECHKRSPYRLWLMHEIASPLLASRLALVARRDHPFAEPLIRRIGDVFITNYDFLNLVRDSCMYAVQQGVAQDMDKGIDQRDREIHRLNLDIHRLNLDIGRLQHQLDREFTRPIVKAFVLQLGRRIVHFGRKNREFVAPKDSRRERLMKSIMRSQRRLRGKVA